MIQVCFLTICGVKVPPNHTLLIIMLQYKVTKSYKQDCIIYTSRYIGRFGHKITQTRFYNIYQYISVVGTAFNLMVVGYGGWGLIFSTTPGRFKSNQCFSLYPAFYIQKGLSLNHYNTFFQDDHAKQMWLVFNTCCLYCISGIW